MKIIMLAGVVLFTGCTYSVMLNHTEGYTSDLVDENQSATNDFKPKINTPLLGG